MTKPETKIIDKLTRAMFAEHLYIGLTRKKNYGLVEARRHWGAAKYSPSEYHFIELNPGTDVNDIAIYLANHDQYVKELEDYFEEQGVLHATCEELDTLAVQLNER